MTWGALGERPDVVYRDDAVILVNARWQDVVGDLPTVDAVITDTPYSARTENGFRTNKAGPRRAVGMGYDPITEEWIRSAVASWRCRSWMLCCGDHITMPWWEEAMQCAGRYTFPPVPIVKRGAAPRMTGDGPASQCEWMMVSRPREARFMGWGSLPGWYQMQTVRAGHGHVGVFGAKSVPFMRAIVGDYSRPGDLILDPCAGGGTTGVAARLEGRRCILIEMDPDTAALAARRLDRNRDFKAPPEQGALFQ